MRLVSWVGLNYRKDWRNVIIARVYALRQIGTNILNLVLAFVSNELNPGS